MQDWQCRRCALFVITYLVVVTGVSTTSADIRDLNWEKLASNPVIPGTSQPGNTGWRQNPWVLAQDGVYRMWMEAGINIMYAESLDGITWSEPIIGIPRHNYGVHSPCVLLDGSTYKMWFVVQDGSGQAGGTWIEYATSPDGHNWTKHGVVLSSGGAGNPDYWILRRPVVVQDGPNNYRMYYGGESQGGGPGHVILATSTDGVNWTRQGVVLEGDGAGFDAYGAWCSSVYVEGGTTYLLYGGHQAPGQPYILGLAWSVDGINFTRMGDPLLPLGDPLDFDNYGTGAGSCLLNVNGDHRLWYTGLGDDNQWDYVLSIGYATGMPCQLFDTDPDTVALWRLNGNGLDDSGNDYDLAIKSDRVSWSVGTCGLATLMGTDPWTGSCFSSDGGALTAPGSACAYPGDGDWTVEAWVRVPPSTDRDWIVQHYSEHVAGHDPYGLGILDGEATFYIDGGDDLVLISADISAFEGAWVHLAGVYRLGTDLALYLDGERIASQSTTTVPEYLPNYDVFVGGNYCGTSTGLQIDEVRISKAPRYLDCNENSIADHLDITSGSSADCNENSIPDECDIDSGLSDDCNLNDLPDECEIDFDADGTIDDCDPDIDDDGVDNDPDVCDYTPLSLPRHLVEPYGSVLGDLDDDCDVDLEDFAMMQERFTGPNN